MQYHENIRMDGIKEPEHWPCATEKPTTSETTGSSGDFVCGPRI